MALEEKVIGLLRKSDYAPGNVNEIAHLLKLKKKEIRQLRSVLQKLVKEGSIAKIKGDTFCMSRDADLISGRIRFRSSGSAELRPDNPDDSPLGKAIYVRAEDTGVALHKDHVLIRLEEERTPPRNPRKPQHRTHDDRIYGRVLRILDRANDVITGTLQQTRLFYHVVPDDPRFTRNILVSDPARSTLAPPPAINQKVVVKLREWDQPHMNPEGEIVEVLGEANSPFAEFQAVLRKHKLDPEFPENVMSEVKQFADTIREQDTRHRKDCRKLFTFTIDPDDAKDFDDALSIERLGGNKLRVGIHIADVTAYVKSNSALEREAYKRGNSTYLVGTVIPMLPHALSNGLCSLVEDEDRLTKCVFLTFDSNKKLIKTEFANTVIRSNKRLTYKQAYAFMTKDDIDEIANTPLPPSHQTGSTGRPLTKLTIEELHKLQDAIRALWAIASKLRTARMKAGSLDLDMTETKIFVDEEGYADRIVVIENDESHQLIEEFMLQANESVARALHELNLPYISRVHDEPDEDKLNELRDHVLSFGVQIGDLSNRREVTRLLTKIKDHPQQHNLKVQFLRSLKQACYRADADGHYGLAKQFYAHFTSPIRRYADLAVHRIFDHFLIKRGLETAPKRMPVNYTKGKLDAVAAHISLTEQNSTEAERESVKIKLLEFYDRESKKKNKTVFEAIISDVRNHGMFIEIKDSQAYGFIPVSTMRDDLYRLNHNKTGLHGRRNGKKYLIGNTVKVTVDKVDRQKRFIDFRLWAGPRPARKSRR